MTRPVVRLLSSSLHALTFPKHVAAGGSQACSKTALLMQGPVMLLHGCRGVSVFSAPRFLECSPGHPASASCVCPGLDRSDVDHF